MAEFNQKEKIFSEAESLSQGAEIPSVLLEQREDEPDFARLLDALRKALNADGIMILVSTKEQRGTQSGAFVSSVEGAANILYGLGEAIKSYPSQFTRLLQQKMEKEEDERQSNIRRN